MTPIGQEDINEPRLRPFGPPRTSNSMSLATILLVLLALAGAYAGYQWFLKPITSSSTATATETTKRNSSATQPSPLTTPAKPALAPALTAQSDARTITKCVANGKTSYGDNDCAPGAATTEFATRSNLNMVAGLKPEQIAAAQRMDAQAIGTTNFAQANAAPSIAAECQALNETIARLDAMARQPQSAQTQDWIRNERKKARDRQFQIQCG